jgi:type II restriction/modification system DNA methylase subunit YeeA
MQEKLIAWVEELSKVRVLDAACGSGNFLYLALKRMLDLWKEAQVFSAQHGLPTILPQEVSPAQLYGLEINAYAHELASVVVWIGYLQWLTENGMGKPTEPILRHLTNIQHRDAILDFDKEGKAIEPEWPGADFIIGNPPFLGDKKMRAELGDSYVESLRALYLGRVPGGADLVTFWFERARAQIEAGKTKRAGLLATQGIRGGANRKVLERIKESGDIFFAESDRNWILDGANVHVSMIGFDDGSESIKILDGVVVTNINSDLSSGATDLTTAIVLPENDSIAFIGTQKGGKFDISREMAEAFLKSVGNPNERPNADVVKPWVNAFDVTGRNRDMWIIDFGADMSESDAALYELPFEYVRKRVKHGRDAMVDRDNSNADWWLHQRPRPEMRGALQDLKRYIVTPRHSKYRLFLWEGSDVLPDSALVAFARDDEYFLGVLHSKPHELWARATGTQVREAESGFRYTPQVCFDPFPFPWPPGKEPQDSPLVNAIAIAARELVQKRDAWLNPPGASQKELVDRTLTKLYNARPAWLADAHRKLDEAVAAAYGWPATLTDPEILQRLLALNHERAAVSDNS